METSIMGRVLTEATVESFEDLLAARKGLLAADKVRSIHLTDALVDTGATTLALPTRMIQQLGLEKRYEKLATTSKGVHPVSVYDAVRLKILDRDCTVDVMEVPDDVPALIGQIPLEMMDLVVDLQGRRLVGNPAHGGEQVLELY